MSGFAADQHQILALDIGQKRIGVARADGRVRLVEPLVILTADSPRLWVELQALIDEYRPVVLVIGWPLNLSGRPTAQTDFVRGWVKSFSRHINFAGHIVYQDEVLSSHVARQGKSVRPRSAVDDRAACVILEDYLQEAGDV